MHLTCPASDALYLLPDPEILLQMCSQSHSRHTDALGSTRRCSPSQLKFSPFPSAGDPALGWCVSGCWSPPLARYHGELFPGLRNESENRPNNVTVFCCYFFFHEQNVQHYFFPLCAILQEGSAVIGRLASAVYTPAACSSCAEGAFPALGGQCWRAVAAAASRC